MIYKIPAFQVTQSDTAAHLRINSNESGLLQAPPGRGIPPSVSLVLSSWAAIPLKTNNQQEEDLGSRAKNHKTSQQWSTPTPQAYDRFEPGETPRPNNHNKKP
jgi:hypothetical protein